MTRQRTRQMGADGLRDRIGQRIREAQKQAGLTNEELAARVGLGLRLVQKHRAGANAPSLENLARYGRVLGYPVSWFFEEAA